MNNTLGWITCAIASFVYLSTIEPTVSFWDCGEYIATAYKLEVGHPPGGPFFQMLGRMFTMFTPADKAALMINALSALCSSFTILFLFWTITALGKSLVRSAGKSMDEYGYAILGSGFIGALAYTFSDTFWFSAVEGEVYAMSSFFTAFVFWAILKWESIPDDKHPDRWIVLIAYLMGLSIGVHLLNLLTIPALALVYYFKKERNPNVAGIIKSLVVGVVLLFAVQYGVVQYLIKLAAQFELLFVNGIGLPFGAGIIVYSVLIIGGVVAGLIWTRRNNHPKWNTVILCFTMLLIGYSSYAQIIIRSSANPPMDENNPENVFSFISYLSREQYGDRPLGYGQYFNAPLDRSDPYDDGKTVYYPDEKTGTYIVTDDRKNSIPKYDKKFCSVFPRMYSDKKNHVRAYKKWSGFKGSKDKRPSFGENMQFFFSYQIGWMYLRYFLWNFAGRQNDTQGHGSNIDGNWLSGINFIDEMRLGPQDNLPESMTQNKAYNRLYFLPLILGLLGLVFHYKNDQKGFLVVTILFLLTGLGIIVFLNQYPYQPRERDYAYAASFYAFAIWIGLGVMAVFEIFRKSMSARVAAGVAVLVCSVVPGIMAKEEWDDHDRSGLYTARDFASNYLNSCAPNAILFTNGDNDTFPLWYAQEVEGIRTDVRVMNLSLSNTDWYIDQMARKAYDSDPVPFSMTSEQYRQGTRDYVPYYDRNIPGYINLKEVMEFVKNDNKEAKLQTQSGKLLNYFPTKKFSLPVNKARVLANGMVNKDLASQIVPAVEWEKKGNYILKNSLMQLDMLAENDWDRPVYFAITVGGDSYLQLEQYFQLEGLAYQFVPIKTKSRDGQTGRVETDIMYDNLMNKFVWGGMDKEVYMNETNMRMTYNLRNNFARLADALLKEGKIDSAVNVMDRCIEVMPDKTIPYNFFMTPLAECYYRAAQYKKAQIMMEKINSDTTQVEGVENSLEEEEKSWTSLEDKGAAIISRLAAIYEDDLDYYLDLEGDYAKGAETETQRAMSVMQRLAQIAKMYKQAELGAELSAKFDGLQQRFSQWSSVNR